LRADVYQRASALSLAIALVSVVLAAFFAAPVTGSSLTPSPIIDNSARAVLIRTMTASERVAFANSGVIPIVDYGAFVLATVSGQASAALQSKGMILRTLTDRSTLYLGSVSFDTAKAAPAIADNLRIASYPAGTAGLYLVQFKGPILSSWLDGLRAQGVRVYNYIPNFAFVVQMTPEQAKGVSFSPMVQWVGVYQPAYRISPLVYQNFKDPTLTDKVPFTMPNGKSTPASLSLSAVAAPGGSGLTASADPFSTVGVSPAAKVGPSYDLSVLILKSAPASTSRSLGAMSHRIYQTMSMGWFELVRVSVDAANLPRIASMPGVYWVEPFYRPHVLDEVSSQIDAGNYVSQLTPGYLAWLNSTGYTGAGIRVAVDDTGVDTGVDNPNVNGDMHPELDNRVVANLWYGSLTNGADGFGHGTHVSGIVAGNGSLGTGDPNGFLWGLGMAPQADIINQRIFDSGGAWQNPSYYSLGSDALNNSASVNSNSWGIQDGGAYLIDDMIYDGLVRDANIFTAGNQSLIFEFSAGNAGWGGGTPVYQSTGSPGNSKNVITTGASLNFRPTVPPPGTWPADDFNASIGFSSRGPTADGRIKPDIVAPGGWIASALSSQANPNWCWQNIDAFHIYCGGTSMSGPMVSGAAALFVQYFRNTTGADPSPAITKAALVNGAVDMPAVANPSFGSFSTGPIPNMDEGWGRLHLGNVIASSAAHFYDDQTVSLATGASHSYQIAVGIVDQPVKVSVAWTDVPGTPGAGTELVNDLDLTVTAPDGTMYLGNNFADGASAPGGTPDSKNNLENVYISNPAVGVYTVTVTGVNVPSGPQDYALVVSYGGGPTPVGNVFWNQGTFMSSALAGLVLMDSDLSGTATVAVTSDTGDAETVTTTEVGNASGVFLGSIQLTSAASSPGDNLLNVVNGGTINVTYDDASPPGTKTATATIDDTPPVISAINTSSVTHNSARIDWLTNEAATSSILYGTTTPPNATGVGGFGLTHGLTLKGLTPNTTYFFEVTATDQAGNTAVDNNGGAYYTFTTLPIPPVLLLDDDFGLSFETYYTLALSAVGQDFVYWDIATQGIPALTDLASFKVVIWYTPGCGAMFQSQTVLTSYLDAGGRLIAIGQDLGYCSNFMSGPLYGTYLHASYVTDNAPTRHVVGVAGDPIGDGLDIQIAGGDGANDQFYPDVVDPIAPAETGVQYDSGPSSRSAILHVDTGTYQTAYLAFNFEAISTAPDRQNMMDRLLSWIIPPLYGVRLSPKTQSSQTVPGATVSYDFKVVNRGIALPQDTFNLAWSSAPFAWPTSLWYANGSAVTDTNGDGVPDTGPIPSKGAITLTATVDVPAAAVDGNADVATIMANSVSLPSASSATSATTLVPPAGVFVAAGPYFKVTPGQTVTAAMSVRNTGGQPDVLNIVATSQSGWQVSLLASDGSPLLDTNDDGIPDVGTVTGLQGASFGVQVTVPAGATPGTIDLTVVVGSSAMDPNATGNSNVVLEYYGPGPADWPTFHNTNQRRGASPNLFGPPMSQLWTAPGNTAALYSGPVYAEGKLFATSIDQFLRARDPFLGTTIWSRYLGDGSGIPFYTGWPTVANGVVYVIYYTLSGGNLYALDANTGATIWSIAGFDFNARIPLAYADGMVFGEGRDGRVFALDATTGGVVWTYQTNGLFPWGGVTVAAGTVWVSALDPTGSSNGYVFSFDEMTGALRWSFALDGWGGSAPLFAQGNVYVGSFNQATFPPTGTLWALNAFSGTPVWSTSGFGGFWFDTPAYDGTNLYVGSVNGAFSGVDATTGTVLWQTFSSGVIFSSVGLANGYVFGTSTDGGFYILDAATGAIVDAHFLSGAGSASAVAIGKGYVWMDDASGTVYAYGAPGAGVMAAIEAQPGTASLSVGSAALFHAQAYDLYGNPSPGGPYSWTSVNGLGTTLPLSANGDQAIYVAGIQTGTDSLRVASGAFSSDATLSILPGALDHVDLSPGVASVGAGATMAFGAAAKDRFGNTIPGANFTWTVTGGIGTIDASGLFTAATTTGTGTVTAQSGTHIGTAIVEIVPGALATIGVDPATITVVAGDNRLLTARGFDRYNNEIFGLSYRWSTTIGSVPLTGATAILASCTVSGCRAGTGTLTIAAGAMTQDFPVTIVPGPEARIDVSPPTGTVVAGGTLAFSGTPRDAFGNAISGLTVAWTVTGGIGTISAGGVLSASNLVGSGTVVASAGNAPQTTVAIAVVPGATSRVTVDQSSLSMIAGATTTLAARVLDAYGNEVTTGHLTWTAGGGSLSRLSSDDRLFLYTAPTATGPDVSISITAVGVSGVPTATITVAILAGPPAAVVISAPQSSVVATGTLAFTAVVTDANGNSIAGSTATWVASAGSIGISSGILTAPQQAGPVLVTATVSGRAAFMTVTVTPASLDHLVVSTNSINVATGAGITLTVTAVDAYGNTVSVPSFTWTTSVGRVDVASDGRTASFFAGDMGGSGKITVSGGGQSKDIPVSVTESSLPLSRQATSATSLLFLVVAILAIAASVFMFVRYRDTRRELEEMRKGGSGEK